MTRNTNFNIFKNFFFYAIVAIVYKMTQTNPLQYRPDFRHKPLDTVATRKQKIKLDNVFVNWFHSNISRIATCYTDIHIRK